VGLNTISQVFPSSFNRHVMQYLNRVVPYTVPLASLRKFNYIKIIIPLGLVRICEAENTRVSIVLTCIV
jgi:hypothetical protein